MDTSDPQITFDSSGVCSHCRSYEQFMCNDVASGRYDRTVLDSIVKEMKEAGSRRDYDCIMGLSGGVDSSYLAHFATKELGLRVLVVHIDTGWNSELAVSNIENICSRLNIDLHTRVLDWDEIRDLQLAFFKASVANLDVPQDHAFIAGLHQEARKYGIKYVLNGGNMATESILPISWGYDASDSWHLKDIHRRYGRIKLRNFPIIGFFQKRIFLPYIKRSRVIRPLEYIEYNKSDVKAFLQENLQWRDYGGKHYESKFTKLFQAHYLPTKFGFDKRKAHLSSLIVSGQINREEAIDALREPLYDPKDLEQDIHYFIKKLGISRDEYDAIMALPFQSYKEFRNQVWLDGLITRAARFAGILVGRVRRKV